MVKNKAKKLFTVTPGVGIRRKLKGRTGPLSFGGRNILVDKKVKNPFKR